MFAVADMDKNDETIEVIASEFFDRKVTLHSIKRGSKPEIVFRRTLDENCGSAFGVILADLDSTTSNRYVVDSGSTVDTLQRGDTFSHVLATSHECNSVTDGETGLKTKSTVGADDENAIQGGSLFAYRVPEGKDAWKTEPWLRTTVASGFRVQGQLGNMINPGAPGFAYTFHPKREKEGSRPLIAVAGDCSESAYIFRPVDSSEQEPHPDQSAQYKLMCEIACGATVGSIGIGYQDFMDADQEAGYAKLYLPCYEKDKVLVFAMGSGSGSE